MDDNERIKLLEGVLIKYVELYGFIDEARNYYISLLKFDGSSLGEDS